MTRQRKVDENHRIGGPQAAGDDFDYPAFALTEGIQARIAFVLRGSLPARLKLNTVDVMNRQVQRLADYPRQGGFTAAAMSDNRDSSR